MPLHYSKHTNQLIKTINLSFGLLRTNFDRLRISNISCMYVPSRNFPDIWMSWRELNTGGIIHAKSSTNQSILRRNLIKTA